MVSVGGNGNPFRPGAGQIPPFLAGREMELALAEKRLAELVKGRVPARGMLFYGPRGNGKTVLLERIAEKARELGIRAERLPARALRHDDRLVEELQERAGLTEGRLSGIQLGPIGAQAQPSAPTRNLSQLLAAWVGAAPGPLVAQLDEVHTMDSEVGRAFFEAVQTCASDGLPLFLIAAGTPDAPRRVRGAGTFAERAFQRLPIGRLAADATTAALMRPVGTAGRRLTPAAATVLAEESQHYPYFVQLLGSAGWDAADHDAIDKAAADRAVASVRVEVERFYMERFDEARERGVEDALGPIAKLMRDQRGRVDDRDLQKTLQLIAKRDSMLLDRASLLTTLRDLGIVWEASSGVWEMGIPSFADYVLRRAGKISGGAK